MGIKRIVNTEVWTDEKTENFSPEDRYFWLYLLTNPFTTQLGIYRLTIKQAAFQLGYSQDSVRVLIDRFQNKYTLIKYIDGEIAIKNYLRHSIVKGGKPVEDCLIKDMGNVKHKELISWVFGEIKNDMNLNATVKEIINKYDNDNDNDNDVSIQRYVHESYYDTSTNRINNKSNKDAQFDAFWKAYPNKKSKQKAHQIFEKINPDDALFEEIMNGLERAKKSSQWIKDNGQFIPHPTTWLNGRRWEDEYECVSAEGRTVDEDRISGIDF